MGRVAVAALQDSGAWASTGGLAVVADAEERLGASVGAILGIGAVADDRVEGTVPPVDLGDYDDLELWALADRAADGSEARPWYLELRLGSAALPVGTANNEWRRLIPLRGDRRWENVLVSITDLPAAVRQAVTAVRFTHVGPDNGHFRCVIDGPWAVRPSVVADVDEGLRALLDEALTLEGTAVPLAIEPPATTVAAPAIVARHTVTRLRPDLTSGTERRTDYRGQTFAVRPAARAVEVGYELRAGGADRDEQAAVFDFALATLATTPTLAAAGRPAALELTAPPEGRELADPPVLLISVITSLRPPAAPVAAVPPFNQVTVDVEQEVEDLANV